MPFVADFLDNAGLGNQVTVDADGVPYISYLIFPAEPKEGEIPVTRPIGAPYIVTETTPATETTDAIPGKPGAAIGVASLADNGVWTRGAAAQVRDTPDGIYIPYGPATVDDLVGATAKNTNGTDIAVDAEGGKHVVWTGPTGIWYASGTDSFAAEPIFRYGSPLRLAGPIGRPSIALDADGNPWIAYGVQTAAGQEIRVATKTGEKWTTTVVASLDPCTDCSQPLGVRIGETPDGPLIAYVDPQSQSVMAASPAGQKWASETVASGVTGEGLDMAIGKDGTAYLSYYTGDGGVALASSTGSGWTVAPIADVGASDPGAEAPLGNYAPTTGLAVDDQGVVYVAWSDPATGSVILASSKDLTTFAPLATRDTQQGAFPSLAVAPDGSKVYLVWYGQQNQDLRLGVQGDVTDLAVAAPSPTPTAVGPAIPADCGKDGQITLDEVALNIQFQDACLVAPAEEPFQINFENQDAGIDHNIQVFDNDAYTDALFSGALLTGPGDTTYDVTKETGPLKKGTYYFDCQVHTTMQGVLAVVSTKK